MQQNMFHVIKPGRKCIVREPGKWFCVTGTIHVSSSGVPGTKVVKEIISVLLSKRGKNMIKPATGCTGVMPLPKNVKTL